MSTKDRLVELEMKAAFQEKRIADLDDALVAQTRRLLELEERVQILEEALRRVGGEVAGEPVMSADEEPPPPAL